LGGSKKSRIFWICALRSCAAATSAACPSERFSMSALSAAIFSVSDLICASASWMDFWFALSLTLT